MGRQSVIVSVLADTKQFARGLGSAASALGGLGAKLGATAAVGAGALAGLGAGVVALAAHKGISRALGIEDATAKLKALGMTGDAVKQTMNDALASVKGTSFGLDAAATVAASAVAAQIKPGQELQRYLGLVADTAQVAGVSMEEMGSIFNKVASNQRITTEEMNQLADRGVPIWKYLAGSMGVTNDELRKMVSDGTVSLDDFTKAIETNLSGAGKVMADTTSGALKNLNASLGRLGAAFAAPALLHAKTLFQEATTAVDGLTTALKPVAEKLEAAFGPKIEAILKGSGRRVADFATALPARLAPLVAGASSVLQPLLSNVSGPKIMDALSGVWARLTSVVQPIVSAIIPVVTQLSNAFAPLIPQIVSLIGTVMRLASSFNPTTLLFRGLAGVLPQIIPIVGQVGESIAALLSQVLPMVAPALSGIVDLVSGLMAEVGPGLMGLLSTLAGVLTGTLVPAIMQLMPILVQIVQSVVAMLVPVLPTIGNLLEAIVAVVGSILQALSPLLPVIISIVGVVVSALAPVLPQIGLLLAAVGDAVAALVVAIAPLIEVVANLLAPVLSVLLAALTPIIDVVMVVANVLASVLAVAIQAVIPLIASCVETVTTGAQLVTSIVGPSISGLAQLVISAFQGVYNVISSVWNAIVGVVSVAIASTVGTITGGMSTALGAVRNFGSELSRSISGAMSSMVAAIGNLGSVLWNAGVSLIDGFVGGIRSAFGRVQATLGSLTSALPSWKGPAPLDKVLLAPAGRMIIGGLVRGLESQYPRVRGSLAGLTRDITRTDFGSPSLDLATVGGGGTVNQYTINVEASMLTPSMEAGRAIADALEQYVRLNGR